jgi:hypothetical protein
MDTMERSYNRNNGKIVGRYAILRQEPEKADDAIVRVNGHDIIVKGYTGELNTALIGQIQKGLLTYGSGAIEVNGRVYEWARGN